MCETLDSENNPAILMSASLHCFNSMSSHFAIFLRMLEAHCNLQILFQPQAIFIPYKASTAKNVQRNVDEAT